MERKVAVLANPAFESTVARLPGVFAALRAPLPDRSIKEIM
jgi:hypothetical protein